MIIKVNDFNLKDTVTCGQIFRFEELDDNSFDIVLTDRVINIKQVNNELIVNSSNMNNIEEVIRNYFDLDYDYESINNKLLEIDRNNKEIIDSCLGLRMINEPRLEVIISYILSSNNRVPQIKNALDNISKTYGKKVLFNNKEYYLFPTIEELSKCDIETLRTCKTGFRDKYIYEFVNKVIDKEFDMDLIDSMDSKEGSEYLMTLNGVGEKVASCILLFGYHRFDVFPIDTWVKKYMKDKYNIEGVENIRKFTNDKYKEFSGIAIQYMFHYKRNKN
ncbi:MAG: 8-oxoguanine DNA glycosylase [Bacilli bacterium]|nr:8-oxoguanine DNA glycosylase [Bacilli bacterium]